MACTGRKNLLDNEMMQELHADWSLDAPSDVRVTVVVMMMMILDSQHHRKTEKG
jgi:hypothetical protein